MEDAGAKSGRFNVDGKQGPSFGVMDHFNAKAPGHAVQDHRALTRGRRCRLCSPARHGAVLQGLKACRVLHNLKLCSPVFKEAKRQRVKKLVQRLQELSRQTWRLLQHLVELGSWHLLCWLAIDHDNTVMELKVVRERGGRARRQLKKKKKNMQICTELVIQSVHTWIPALAALSLTRVT